MTQNSGNRKQDSSDQFSPVNSTRNFVIGIREKLIAIFVAIKVLPLIFLALFAIKQIGLLGLTVKEKSEEMVVDTRELVNQVGTLAVDSSIMALDMKARESIERLTTDTARQVADFLYDRDLDINAAASLSVTPDSYRKFLENRRKNVVYQGEWKLSEDGREWLPPTVEHDTYPAVYVVTPDNKKDFNYRRPPSKGVVKSQPLYHEMTFVDLKGEEKIKISATALLPEGLFNVADPVNTWCRSENYFEIVKDLQPGEIYVSEVIGPYVPTTLIGSYTRETAEKKGVAFAPEKAGYAGKENPVGKRFEGIVRWVSPVYQGELKIGYVTLALDHTHLMEYTDHLVPTSERYSEISDAGSGNYAFMWDYKGRNISHPRDYFIVGYDPQTGGQAVPWLSQEMYELWLTMDRSFEKFELVAPEFHEQSLERKPAGPLTTSGMVALDCRYLNFAPQCNGWRNLTQFGGSGSFVIFWSKLWKLTTAAAIPYYTGIYSDSPRGFGFITIGANVDEFHSSATQTAEKITTITEGYEKHLQLKKEDTLVHIDDLLGQTIENLTVSTGVMVLLVVCIAFWMASVITRKITFLIKGIRAFKGGELSTRLPVESRDEFGQLTGAFNEMSDTIQDSMEVIHRAKEKAEESDKAKSLFLANMSHEIRTPMNAIIGMSHLAYESSEGEKQRALLESVKTSADSLLSVINDILDFSKIEAGQLDLECHTFSLHALIKNAIKSISVLARNKEIEVQFYIADSVPKAVYGDQMRLRQILLNLLGNGVKFTRKGEVNLEVRSRSLDGDEIEVQFVVRDTGVGIAPENHELIFDRFSQSDISLVRKHQGAGLGLSISQQLCQMMGGDIRVESELGVGATFTFCVILKKSSQVNAAVDSKGEDTGLSELYTILLVEDNAANSELARMVLEQQNHRVTCAMNGLEALHRLTIDDFDIVLMDVQMPEMDGFTASKIIRSCERGKATSAEIPELLETKLRTRLYGGHQPIVALTAHAMRGDKEKCIAAGMDEYLTKPFVASQVVAVLKRYAGLPVEQDSDEVPADPDVEELSLYNRAKDNLKEAYLLNDEQVESFLETTVSNMKQDLVELHNVINSADLARVKQIAHSLKGILLNLRMEEHASIAADIEQLAASGEQAGLEELNRRLSDSLADLLV